MNLNIIKPTSSQILEINWIEVNTDNGSFIVQKGHAPLITVIESSKELTIELHDGSITVMTVNNAIIEVNRDYVTLLLTQE